MSLGSLSAISSNVIMQQKPPPASGARPQPSQADNPRPAHHHAGGARGTGQLTSASLTSSGSTPVLDTLV